MHNTSLDQKITYDAWGYQQLVTGTVADTNRMRWKGLVWEGDSARLYYVRNRWYDPVSARFMSEDPSGLEAGINAYSFGDEDPVNHTDPTGLDVEVCSVQSTSYYHWTIKDGRPDKMVLDSVHVETHGDCAGHEQWAEDAMAGVISAVRDVNPTTPISIVFNMSDAELVLTGLADALSLGLGKWIREHIPEDWGGCHGCVNYRNGGYNFGWTAGLAANVAFDAATFTLAATRDASVFARGSGVWNRGDFFRIGWGWKQGVGDVFRIASGGNNWGWHIHFDIFP